MSLNRVLLLGHLGRDPETKETKTGTVVCNLSLATSKKIAGVEKTEWHRVVCFGKTAEFCAKYLTKGRLVFIEGELQTRSWEQNGEKRYMTEVVASRVEAVWPRAEPEQHWHGPQVDPPTPIEDIPF